MLLDCKPFAVALGRDKFPKFSKCSLQNRKKYREKLVFNKEKAGLLFLMTSYFFLQKPG